MKMSLSSMKLRDYQQKLFNVCIDKNSILYLPTGSGKTLIAVKVIDHFSGCLKKPLKSGGKRSLFLVNTVCLGKQVTEEIRKLLGLEVACWNSESHKKSWSKEKFHSEFEKAQIIVATAQLFLDAVKHSFISISQLNVIVFDECHHGRKNHPYHELMKQFKYVRPVNQPRIIGLSGMLIGISSEITVSTINDELKALESTFLSTIVTVRKLEEYKNVLLYSTNPKEGLMKIGQNQQSDLTEQLCLRVNEIRWNLSLIKIDSLLTINPQTLRKTKPKKLKEISLLFEDFKFELEEMGPFGGFLSLQGIRVQLGLIKKQANQHRQILKIVDVCLDYVQELVEMIENEIDFNNLTVDKILENSSMKVRNLIALLISKFSSPNRDKSLQCLIFMQRRFTAKSIYHLLKRYAEIEPSFTVKPDFVVGVNSQLPESIEEVQNSNNNKFAIERFSSRKTNCICASSVLEEGMDLQACNLVIMYDYPMTFRSYIQSKGRARSQTSDYIVLVPNGVAEKFSNKRDEYDEIDEELKKILIGKACDRELDEEAIEKERLELWDPLITQKKALLNNISSVALLNRYISRFANANLLWDRKDLGPNKTVAVLRLPPQSGIKKPIESDVFEDIKVAKQNAAFKACNILHEIGKLDEHLMPVY